MFVKTQRVKCILLQVQEGIILIGLLQVLRHLLQPEAPISVDFGSADATISVAEQSPTGCIGDTVELTVDVIVQPTPVITGSNQVCAGTKGEPYSVSWLTRF